jgi:hypothetical protein
MMPREFSNLNSGDRVIVDKDGIYVDDVVDRIKRTGRIVLDSGLEFHPDGSLAEGPSYVVEARLIRVSPERMREIVQARLAREVEDRVGDAASWLSIEALESILEIIRKERPDDV